jgi:ubiquinone biosynthesis protein Coq4
MTPATVSKPQDAPVGEGPAGTAARPTGRVLDEAEARYMQGAKEPVTSSVLISNSKYLNNPYYRDAFAQSALRRVGNDLPFTYMIPAMVKAITEVSDHAEFFRLIAEEKLKNPDFAAWVDARRYTTYRADDLRSYADGTLGAAIRVFLEQSGMDMEFMKPKEITSDLQYTVQRRAAVHDIEHIVTGFGPNPAGEEALALMNIVATARYLTPALAQYFSHANCFTSISGYSRVTHHYHGALPTFMDAMQKGIAAGLALKRPMFLEEWESYLDWQLDDLAAHLGFERGPGPEWDWTSQAAMG